MAGIALLIFCPTENETPDTKKRVSGFLYQKQKPIQEKKLRRHDDTTHRNTKQKTKMFLTNTPNKNDATHENDTPKTMEKIVSAVFTGTPVFVLVFGLVVRYKRIFFGLFNE